MRRKDRQVSKEKAIEFIDCATYGVLSMVAPDGSPYAVLLSRATGADKLYFHAAKAGTKNDILAKNPDVHVTFVCDNIIPDDFTNEQLDELVNMKGGVGQLGNKVFTTYFSSALVTGTVRMLEDDDEKMHALRVICQKYTPDKMAYFEMAAKHSMAAAALYQITMKTVMGKQKV